MKGRVVGDYVIDSLIGRGGMGSVYRGYHQNSNKEVAIKLLEPILADNKHFRERFRQEAFVMEKLNHPNIVAFYDYIEQEEDVFLVMEYVEGITLDKIIEKQGKISEARAKELLVQMSNALAYAHSQGIIHRDIKPSNFIINLETNKLKVLDFGIAKMLGENAQQLTKTGIQMGSILFMSPEQVKAEKDITHRTDIYSMGFTYYFMLTGTHPLQHYSSEYSIYEAIVSKNVIDFNKLKNFSKVTNEIIHRCLQKNPKERFATTLEIISLLKSEKVEENVSEKSLDSSKKRVLKKWIFSIMFMRLFRIYFF
jgi:serine/threonine-protein kinase